MKYLIVIVASIVAFYIGFYLMFIDGIIKLHSMFFIDKIVTSAIVMLNVGKIMFSVLTIVGIIYLSLIITGLKGQKCVN